MELPMTKRLAIALMLASSLSVVAAPADAGPLRDLAKKAVIGVVGIAAIGGSCVVQVISGRQQFLCPRR
jgi:hypothetical protein